MNTKTTFTKLIDSLANYLGYTRLEDYNILKDNIKVLEVDNSKLKENLSILRIDKNNLKYELNKLKPKRKGIEVQPKTKKFDQVKLKAWAMRVKEVGKCDICHTKEKLTAHHLWDKATHPTLAYQDSNGVCLCEEHHNNFHKMYTKKSQTSPILYDKFKIITQTDYDLAKRFK